jgi:subtilisin-like proprotein convertase family protein
MRSMIRSRGVRRAVVVALCTALALPGAAAGFVSHKLVSGPNVTVPASGAGNPYPSALDVSGLDGVIESMTVTFFVTHATPDDLDVLLVGPNGAKVVLMSDVGGTADLSNKQIRFRDGAAVMPDNTLINQVEYRPTNVGGTDTFPAPAPGGTAASTLAAAFGGINPNGQWRLFVIDDSAGTGGTVNSWRVTITTRVTIQGAGASIPASGRASTYPSLIRIGRLRGRISRVEVRINGINHNNPDDIDALLLGPSGKRLRLMSDAGGPRTWSTSTCGSRMRRRRSCRTATRSLRAATSLPTTASAMTTSRNLLQARPTRTSCRRSAATARRATGTCSCRMTSPQRAAPSPTGRS